MKEIRIHARAGQGAITTASLLGTAAFIAGKYALAFPHFGAERMGAPMNAFVRLSEQAIRLRSQVYEPDYLIVLDPSLMRGFDVFEGFRPGGVAIINHHEKVQCPKPIENIRVYTVPGNDIATEVLGRPIGNTTILGAFAAATNEFGLESLQQAILERFSGEVAKKNAEAARRGYEYITKGF